MLRGISNTGPFGQAKQCVINAFDTDYLMSAGEVMANVEGLHGNAITGNRTRHLRIRSRTP